MRNPSRSLRLLPVLAICGSSFVTLPFTSAVARADTSLPDEGLGAARIEAGAAPASDVCAGDDPSELRRAVDRYCTAAKRGTRDAHGCRVLQRHLRGCASVYMEKDHAAADAWVEEPGHSEYLWHISLRRVAASWQVVRLVREEESGC